MQARRDDPSESRPAGDGDAPAAPGAPSPRPRSEADVFVGRERDLAALAELFDADARLVTLTGTGGVGKTRLAREFVAQRGSRAAVFADLSDARDLEGLCTAVARALGVALGGAPVEQLGRALRGRGDEARVVLDNFEQLAPHAPATVGRWLELAPEARFLVTSRERLRLAEEHVHEVGPLGVDDGADADSDALQLLLARMRRVAPAAPAAADRAALAAIVRRLDGLPLAIELAAARLNTLSPAQLLERLARRFALLAHGRRDADARHATLRSAIEWSWNLLGPDERAALAQCAVFSGGFALEAAEAVLAGLDALDTLQALRDKSLVQLCPAPAGAADARPRFALYVSIREYASEQLEADGALAAAAHARHAAHYAAFAARCAAESYGPDGVAARARLATERENITAAVDRLLAPAVPADDAVALAARALLGLDKVVWTHGPFPAHLARLDRVLSDGRPAEPLLRARALLSRNNYARRTSRLADATRDADEALALARAGGDRALEGRALQRLALTRLDAGEIAAARAGFAAALEVTRAAGERAQEAWTLGDLSDLLRECGELDAARECGERALAIHRAAGDQSAEALTLASLATNYLERGEWARGHAYHAQALTLVRATGDRRIEGAVLGGGGGLYHDEGRPAEALASYEAAVHTFLALGDRRLAGVFTGYAALVRHELGQLDEARVGYVRACDLLRAASDARYSALFATCLRALEAARAGGELADDALPDAPAALRDGDPMLGPVSVVLRALLDLVRAERAEAGGDAPGAARERDRARARLATLPGMRGDGALCPIDARLALRLLPPAFRGASHAGDPAAPPSTAAPDARGLLVHPEGRWFRTPSGERVACHHRDAPRRVLMKLVAERQRAPGAVVARADLVAAGWPGELILATAARARLHVAVSTLRKMGLRDLIVTDDADGYYLDPAVPLRVGDEDEGDDAAARAPRG